MNNAPPLDPPLDVLIVGAGFAGLYMLIKARRQHLRAQVLEAAGGIGGTWYHNRYPGARVDVQSMEYSFSFDEVLQQQWQWSERYSPQGELLRYANHVADRFALRDGIRLNTRVVAASYDDGAAIWQVRAEGGERWSARFLVMASGPLSSPNQPQFEGLDDFLGPVYHTARWPDETIDFSGQRVAVIGTGSSGVQSIPVIAERARELTVFQRTAAYAVPAHNGPLDPAYSTRIKSEYPAFRQRNLRMSTGFGSELPPSRLSALDATPAEREAAFEERWRLGGFSLLGAFHDILLDERANALAAEFVRGKIRQTVRDPRVADLLCPSHTIGCKRLCVDTGYYATYNRDNVRLVDISRAPIERFTENGLVVAGHEHRFDSVVLATGFDAMTGTLMRLELKGRDGLPIQHKWQGGPLNYLGLAINGFPNLFNIAGPGSSSAFTNVIVSIEHHVDWIAACIAHLDAHGLRSIEAREDAEAGWVAHVTKVAAGTVFLSCNSWYLGANIAGKPRMFMPLLGFPAYAQRCAEVAAAGYPGFELR